MGFLDFLTKTIAVDIGSAYLRIASMDRIVFNQPSAISSNKDTGLYSGIGDNIIEGEPHKTLWPVKTTIENFEASEILIKEALKIGIPQTGWLPKSFRMFLSVPISVSQVDKRAYRDSAEHANAKEVYMVAQPVCMAVGMKILMKKKNFVLVDIGAGKVESTVFINSIPKAIGVTRIGMNKLKSVMANHIWRTHQITPTDEELSQLLLIAPGLKDTHIIQGVEIPSLALNELLMAYLKVMDVEIIEAIECAEKDHDLAPVRANGIYFTGGGVNIPWIVDHMASNLNMTVTISSSPLMDCINGLSLIMKRPENYKPYLMT